MSVLIAKDIKKRFATPEPVEVLTAVSLEVRRGESVAITGRSGEGKSTLLHILGTLESFDAGSLTIAGHLVSSGRCEVIRNQHIGFIFQMFHLLDDFSVMENITMPALIGRKPVDMAKAKTLIDQVGLSKRAHFPARLLSGGEKQRVAIARALFGNPDLILADEPTGNLDLHNANIIGKLLIDLTKNHGKSLVLVTHDTELASLCNRQYHLQGGHLVDSIT
jgi:lipoprotein-releasing system ATP-binding protein